MQQATASHLSNLSDTIETILLKVVFLCSVETTLKQLLSLLTLRDINPHDFLIFLPGINIY